MVGQLDPLKCQETRERLQVQARGYVGQLDHPLDLHAYSKPYSGNNSAFIMIVNNESRSRELFNAFT